MFTVFQESLSLDFIGAPNCIPEPLQYISVVLLTSPPSVRQDYQSSVCITYDSHAALGYLICFYLVT
jgi:hypothetical protein